MILKSVVKNFMINILPTTTPVTHPLAPSLCHREGEKQRHRQSPLSLPRSSPGLTGDGMTRVERETERVSLGADRSFITRLLMLKPGKYVFHKDRITAIFRHAGASKILQPV